MRSIDVISYRKLDFSLKFGHTVRDLMILRALRSSPTISRVTWYERPAHIVEIITKRSSNPRNKCELATRSGVDWSLYGPARYGRAWAASSMSIHDSNLASSESDVLLDFNPFYIPPREAIDGKIYWYDMIDNFLLHNRFTDSQLAIVRKKYDFVRENATVISSVSAKSQSLFPRAATIDNRLLKESWPAPKTSVYAEFDFGFLGFITNKFDIDFVKGLADRGFSVFIAGAAYDAETVGRIKSISGVHYHGAFSVNEAATLVERFKVGLIPYRVELLHDESPIKFFQYVAMGRPVLSSTKFSSVEDKFVENVWYYDKDFDAVAAFHSRVTRDFPATVKAISSLARTSGGLFWEDDIDDILTEISGMR